MGTSLGGSTMVRTIPALLFLGTVIVPAASSQGYRDSATLSCGRLVDSAGRCLIYEPSIIQLIARPELYDGKLVRVIGFIHFEFEGDGIYVHKEDWEHHIYDNGLWVE